ncbi:MAG: hypothetical protein AAGF20_04875 [Pseudomonadota bacterium]
MADGSLYSQIVNEARVWSTSEALERLDSPVDDSDWTLRIGDHVIEVTAQTDRTALRQRLLGLRHIETMLNAGQTDPAPMQRRKVDVHPQVARILDALAKKR